MRLLILISFFWAVSSNPYKWKSVSSGEVLPRKIGVDPDFDCKMRQLGWEYAKKLQPYRGSNREVFDALQLGTLCHLPTPPSTKRFAYFPITTSSRSTFFVDTSKGSDNFLGTLDQPLKTLHAALKKSREVSGIRSIVLRSGTYYLSEPLLLGPQDSDLIIQNYEGEDVTVSGGVPIHGPWTPYNTSGSKNIFVTSIQGTGLKTVQGLQIQGKRVTRARYPNCNPETDVPDNRIPGDSTKWIPPPTVKPGGDQILLSQPARLTGDEFQTYRGGIDGICSIYNPPFSYWCSNNTQGGGPEHPYTPSGVIPKTLLPHTPYKNGTTAIFNVWRPARWANWMFETKSYDAATSKFEFGRGGFQGARGNTEGGDWFVENVFEELDAPNEFFFDEVSGRLFLYYNGTGSPPTDGSVVVPNLKVLVKQQGTRWNPVKNVKLQGITYTATAITYMDDHGVPGGGDWALERTAAIFLEGTEGSVIDNCVLTRLDGNAIMISGYNKNTAVLNSDISWIGNSAIASWGYTNETGAHPEQGIDGTDGNHPVGNMIIGNTIHEVGLYEKQSSFYIQAKTALSTIKSNTMFNGPRAGVNYNDGFGGGDVLAENIIFNTCRESGDHGPFNSWDRQPFLTIYKTGKPSLDMAWRTISYNFMIANYESQEAVDNDDGSCYYETHHNFMAYSGNGMKNDFGGHDNIHHNNLYAFVDKGFEICPQLPGHNDYFFNNTVISTTSGNYGDGACTGGAAFVVHDNKIFTPTGTASICNEKLPNSRDPGTTVAKTPSNDQIIAWGKQLLGVQY